MTVVCCVPSCDFSGPRIFHSFPKNPYICQLWINKTKCYHLDKDSAFKKWDKVCRCHFREEDYKFLGSRFLKRGVVPSLNLPKNENITDEHSYCVKNSIVSSSLIVI